MPNYKTLAFKSQDLLGLLLILAQTGLKFTFAVHQYYNKLSLTDNKVWISLAILVCIAWLHLGLPDEGRQKRRFPGG